MVETHWPRVTHIEQIASPMSQATKLQSKNAACRWANNRLFFPIPFSDPILLWQRGNG